MRTLKRSCRPDSPGRALWGGRKAKQNCFGPIPITLDRDDAPQSTLRTELPHVRLLSWDLQPSSHKMLVYLLTFPLSFSPVFAELCTEE